MSTIKDDTTYELFNKVIGAVQRKNDKEKANDSLLVKQAKVIGVNSDTNKVFVYFIDDINQTSYTLYNKTGEVLSEGDTVKVYYTSNPAKGWVGIKCGESGTSNPIGLEPITAITINSDIDYTVSTNAGQERYVGIFEAT